MKVVIIGPSTERTKGGIATVIEGMLAMEDLAVRFTHIVSHVEGGAGEKLRVAARGLWRLLTFGGADLVHIHVAERASMYRKSLFCWVAWLRRLPVVMHVHGADFDAFYRGSSAPARWYMRTIFRKCSKVIVLSGYWKSFFEEQITPRNVEVLYNGVNSDEFANCYTMPSNLHRFLFLGRLGQRKGAYDLVEAVHRLLGDKDDPRFRLFMAGDGEVEQIRALVREKGLSERIEVLGWIGPVEKKQWLTEADTMVLPSYNEGLPMSILEAMAAGKVIISGRVGGIPDLVVEGENGYLITPGDIPALVDRLRRVMDNEPEMTGIALRNRQKIRETFDLRQINARLIGIYRAILNGRRPTQS